MALYNAASTSNFREYANGALFNQTENQTGHTLACWVHPNITPVAQWGYVARGAGLVAGEFTLGTPSSASFNLTRAQIITASGSQTVADTLTFTNNNWQHVCQTWDGTNLKVYVNGRLRNTSTPAGTFTQSSTNNVRLWMRTDGTIGTTDAYIEQFGWWRTALSAAEVDALSRGYDFTKIRRNDAILLDKLDSINGVDIVSGLGTNTGTITVKEPCPILRPHLGQFWTQQSPNRGSGRTRRREATGVTITLLLSGWEPRAPETGTAPRRPFVSMEAPQPAFSAPTLGSTGWEPAAPLPFDRPAGQGSNADVGGGPAQLAKTGWEPTAPVPVDKPPGQGFNADGDGVPPQLKPSGWEPPPAVTVSPRGRGAVDALGPWLAFLARTGWEPAQPTPQSPRGKTGINFDGPLLAFLLPGGWEPLAPWAAQPHSPIIPAPLPLAPFTGALLATGWEPPGPVTVSPRGRLAPSWDGPTVAFPLRTTGFEPLAPWTVSPRGKVGVDFGPLSGFVVVLGKTGWEPPGSLTISPRGKLAPSFDGPLVAFPLRAGGWEPPAPVTRSPRPGIGVNHDATIPILSVLGVVGWESAAAFARRLARAQGAGGDAAPMSPPPLKAGWEPASPYLPRTPRPGVGVNWDSPAVKRLLAATGWEPESPRTRSPRGAPGPNFDGSGLLALLRATGWEPPGPQTKTPRPGVGVDYWGPMLAKLGVTGWEPAQPTNRPIPPGVGAAYVAWNGLFIPPALAAEMLFGPPSTVAVADSRTDVNVESSVTRVVLTPYDE